MARPDITLILPAYNEAATILKTVAEALAYFESSGKSCQLIVAADGKDGTRELVRTAYAGDPRITVIGCGERRGKGRGIRDAVALATGSIVGYADADNKVPIEEYGKMEPWLARGSDIVVGSRALAGSRIERRQPLYRRLGSWGFYWTLKCLVGLPGIADSQCGFKFFRGDVAKDLFSRQQIDGYMFDVEILALAQALGYTIVQVPIRWRDDGDSRLELIRGNLQNAKDLFRIRRSLARLDLQAERRVATSRREP